MLLTYTELSELVASGVIDADPIHINAASIDVCLGSDLLVEAKIPDFTHPIGHPHPVVDLADKLDDIRMDRIVMDHHGYVLKPGRFCLAHTVETFHLPDDVCAHFVLRSSVARRGLNHLLAGFADPGWHGAQLTLELHNVLQNHSLLLKPGMRIGQMVFFRGKTVPEHQSYAAKGRYNRQSGVVASKGA